MGIFDFLKKRNTSSHRDEVIKKTFDCLDANLKRASIAQIGGFKPTNDPLASRFSGSFAMLPEESWPEHQGNPLQSFLQIRVSDLPYVPRQISEFQLITVFVDEDNLPYDKPNGQGWLVRAYKTLDNLKPRDNPIQGSHIRPFEIQWKEVADEGPNWEDAWTVCDLDEFNNLDDTTDLYYDTYENHYFTKVGGWPSLIQSSLNMGAENFVFQIGSEEKANWSWVDQGTAYFGIKDGDWVFECQFY